METEAAPHTPPAAAAESAQQRRPVTASTTASGSRRRPPSGRRERPRSGRRTGKRGRGAAAAAQMHDPNSVRVCVRVRPLVPAEVVHQCQVCTRLPGGKKGRVIVMGRDKQFTFDRVYNDSSTQAEVPPLHLL